jgi:precorrin-3B C17-methyltransferase
VVGIGPGDRAGRTIAAEEAIRACAVMVGYKTYTACIADLTPDKLVEESGMRDEVQRVRRAIAHALEGRQVALISSGDPGVYGMAGLALELCRAENIDVGIRIYPGVTAANAAAALLGAPLSCDYCVLSLSDLLVPRERILTRARAAAAGDFVTVLYNPASHKRTQLIRDVQRIYLDHRPLRTPVGIVRDIGRTGQTVMLTSLDRLHEAAVDMVSTVTIGNSQSTIWHGRLLTPRGYRL